jgi:hypothetical protein
VPRVGAVLLEILQSGSPLQDFSLSRQDFVFDLNFGDARGDTNTRLRSRFDFMQLKLTFIFCENLMTARHFSPFLTRGNMVNVFGVVLTSWF